VSKISFPAKKLAVPRPKMCRKRFPDAEKPRRVEIPGGFPLFPRGKAKKISKSLKINKFNELNVLVEMKLYINGP
jgi:hypothetical protein